MGWPGSAVCDGDGYKVYHAGNNDTEHLNEVTLQRYIPICDWVVISLGIMELNNALDLVKASENTIVLGDFNAKLGKGCCLNNVGDYRLGNRNEHGDCLV